MCGIAAIFNYATGEPVNRGQMGKMLAHMQRRGPDGAGEWYGPRNDIGLGHRRLSIIDLSEAGAQPMVSADGRCVVTFNGEIYNYRELRADLEKRGRRFRSQSDTEVLLHLYQLEGAAMLPKLRGMFAFAIWDETRRGLLLARDPLGIKPLYYADDGRTIRVASQVKTLLAGGDVDTTPEPAGHVGFFLWGHLPMPFTLFRGIRGLPNGTSLWVDREGAKPEQAFFSVTQVLADAERKQSEIGTGFALRAALLDSVRHHLIADVPVGIFLSSGMDSTTLAALASESTRQLRTVTLGFDEFRGKPNDETPLAEEVARRYGADHQTIWVTRKDFENDLHRLLAAMDQPSCDGVNSYFISKAAAQAGLKVALSGLGGDELFGGYSSFNDVPRAVAALQPFRLSRPLGAALRAVSAPFLKRMTSPKYAGLLEYGGTYGGAYLLRRGMFMPWELPRILDGELVREGWRKLETLARLNDSVNGLHLPHFKVAALEMQWYMRNQLLRDTDWASMDHSLEVRTPLVDSGLLTAVAPLFTQEPRPTKRDLALTPDVPLPAAVMHRVKTGFTVPVREWLLKAFDPSAGTERGLRGWAHEVYSIFADNLENHRAALRRRRHAGRRRRAAADAATRVPSAKRLRIFVLVTDAFGGFGGIAKFNRDFLTALCAHERVEEVVALTRIMPQAPEALPAKLVFDTSGLGGKWNYLRALWVKARAFRGRNTAGSQPVIICAHIHLLPLALLARRLCGGTVHLIVHGIDAWAPTRSPLANALVRRIDGFIAVSNVTKRRFMRWSGLHDEQGVVLPNCVDLSAFAPGIKSEALLERYQLRGKKVILTLGRLASEERYKGFDEVLQVMPELLREMPDLCYLICGDGQDRPRLVAKARALGLRVEEAASGTTKRQDDRTMGRVVSSPQVVFAGRIPDAEKADHFRLADVYVMPSSGEGFGIVYLEALACGIPVIGSRADGSREALLNGQLGILVDPRDGEEIIAAVRGVLKQNGNAESGRRKVENPSAFNFQLSQFSMNSGSVDYFSALRFQQRVHDILECIAGGTDYETTDYRPRNTRLWNQSGSP